MRRRGRGTRRKPGWEGREGIDGVGRMRKGGRRRQGLRRCGRRRRWRLHREGGGVEVGERWRQLNLNKRVAKIRIGGGEMDGRRGSLLQLHGTDGEALICGEMRR